jgi:hypothetical protein
MIAASLLVVTMLSSCSDKNVPGEEDRDTSSKVLTLFKGENSSAPDNLAFSVVMPKPNQVVKGDSISVVVHVENFALRSPTQDENTKGIAFSKDGQHVHIILDDKPYMAQYDDTMKFGGLAPGAHTLRAFPSRSWHESVKSKGAFVARTFYVNSKTGTPAITDTAAPMLTYSRPKGKYEGADARRVMLDFYVNNAELGADKYKVVATIDNKLTDTLTSWTPYFIEGMGDGDHTVKLQLIGPDNQPVPGPFNTTERTITIVGKDVKDTTKK